MLVQLRLPFRSKIFPQACKSCGRIEELLGEYCVRCSVSDGSLSASTIGEVCSHGRFYDDFFSPNEILKEDF